MEWEITEQQFFVDIFIEKKCIKNIFKSFKIFLRKLLIFFFFFVIVYLALKEFKKYKKNWRNNHFVPKNKNEQFVQK